VRSRAGLALAIAGAGLLLITGSIYARGALARDRARSQWDALMAHQAVESAHREGDRGRRTSFARGAPIARLVIPTAHVDEIIVEGIGGDQLNAGPGHIPASALPGETGRSVISAHRDRHFRTLDRVRVGDTLTTETALRSTTWVVVSRRILPKDTRVLFKATAPILTLTTCWPMGYFGAAPDRLVLEARPVA
jgi:sortase A